MKKLIFKIRVFISNDLFKLAFITLPSSDYKTELIELFNDFNYKVSHNKKDVL